MRKKLVTWMAAGCLFLGSMPVAWAAQEDEPGAGTMIMDAVVARPVGLLITTVGAAAFVVSLPFSALGGNVDKAAEALVLAPGRMTFTRCLGCRTEGRYQDPDR